MCCQFNFSGIYFTALGSGALWWAERRLLCVSDLHLGKSERVARRGGAILPPYETQDTLERLEQDLQDYPVETVVCLGDSFDDMTAGRSLPTGIRGWVARLQRSGIAGEPARSCRTCNALEDAMAMAPFIALPFSPISSILKSIVMFCHRCQKIAPSVDKHSR